MVYHLTVVLPNEPGVLLKVAETLTKKDVNIWAYHLANTGRGGYVQLLCDPHDIAYEALVEEYGHFVSEQEVLAVAGPNKPGVLTGVLEVLWSEKVNVAHSYQTHTGSGRALIILDFDNHRYLEAARDALTSSGYDLVDNPTHVDG